MNVAFSKYHGLGNDFVLVDCRKEGEPVMSPDEAAGMCDRNFGVGADGVIFVLPPDVPEAQYRMRIYNSDGSEVCVTDDGFRVHSRAPLLCLGASSSRQSRRLDGALIAPHRAPSAA